MSSHKESAISTSADYIKCMLNVSNLIFHIVDENDYVKFSEK